MRRVLILVTSLTMAAPAAAVAQSSSSSSQVESSSQQNRERSQRREQSRRDNRAEETERTTRTVNIGANGEIDVTNISGDMSVTRGSGNSATIEIIKTARAETSEEARALLSLVPVDVAERGARVEVKTRYPNEDDLRRRNRRNIHLDVAFNITVPPQTRVNLHSISGSFVVRDVAGPLQLDTISGNIKLSNTGRSSAKTISGNIEVSDTTIEGILTASTISGNVAIKKATARGLTLSTVSGSIGVEDATCERVESQAVSGDVWFSGELEPNGRYELSSHSGSVKVAIGSKTGFQVDASSFSGGIRTDLPINVDGMRKSGRSLQGRYGNGSAILDLNSFSGSIVITKR
jgi:DUF4097 and DUF4098 domain-containing protein YvlB